MENTNRVKMLKIDESGHKTYMYSFSYFFNFSINLRSVSNKSYHGLKSNIY